MTWSYRIFTPTEAQLKARRISLDEAGRLAQFSVLLPVFVLLAVRFGKWIVQRVGKTNYDVIPGSPIRKADGVGTGARIAKVLGRVSWWMDEEVVKGWGDRKFWIAGGGWWGWLVFLCVWGTGDGKFIFFMFDLGSYLDISVLRTTNIKSAVRNRYAKIVKFIR